MGFKLEGLGFELMDGFKELAPEKHIPNKERCVSIEIRSCPLACRVFNLWGEGSYSKP